MSNFSNIIYLNPNQIHVTRDSRQRQEIDISDIKDSILKNGVINPIIIQKIPSNNASGVGVPASEPFTQHVKNGCCQIIYQLIAGERRLEACRQLNLQIPCRFKEDLLPSEAEILEFEENHKRQNLTWREEVKAIGNIHTSYLNQNPNHTQEETAKTLSIPTSKLSQILYVYKNLDEKILNYANNFTQAHDLLQRFMPQKTEKLKENIKQILDKNPLPEYLKPITKFPQKITLNFTTNEQEIDSEPVLNLDFTTWIKDYKNHLFQFIHCDFPQDPKSFWPLTNCFFGNLQNILHPHAHILFWLNPEYFPKIIEFCQASKLKFLPRPLIWYKSDTKSNSIISQPPKPTYECALILINGNREFKHQIQDAYHTPRASFPICPNQKSQTMLKYFFQTFIDSDTRVLDPTCGSGSALCAAEELNAKHTFGLELDPARAQRANEKILKQCELNQILKRK